MNTWLVVGYSNTIKSYLNRTYHNYSKKEAYDDFNHTYPEYVITNIIKL